MTALAAEANELAARYNAAMISIDKMADRIAPDDSLWQAGAAEYYPLLAPIADMIINQPAPTAAWKLNPNRIREGSVTESGENPKAWAKSNKAMNNWLKKLEKALNA